MIACVATRGARIVREGKRLLVRKDSDTRHTLCIWKLEQPLVLGNVPITPPALGRITGPGAPACPSSPPAIFPTPDA
jgi:CRISPR/Cas system-associated endonuclease Cas1